MIIIQALAFSVAMSWLVAFDASIRQFCILVDNQQFFLLPDTGIARKIDDITFRRCVWVIIVHTVKAERLY